MSERRHPVSGPEPGCSCGSRGGHHAPQHFLPAASARFGRHPRGPSRIRPAGRRAGGGRRCRRRPRHRDRRRRHGGRRGGGPAARTRHRGRGPRPRGRCPARRGRRPGGGRRAPRPALRSERCPNVDRGPRPRRPGRGGARRPGARSDPRHTGRGHSRTAPPLVPSRGVHGPGRTDGRHAPARRRTRRSGGRRNRTPRCSARAAGRRRPARPAGRVRGDRRHRTGADRGGALPAPAAPARRRSRSGPRVGLPPADPRSRRVRARPRQGRPAAGRRDLRAAHPDPLACLLRRRGRHPDRPRGRDIGDAARLARLRTGPRPPRGHGPLPAPAGPSHRTPGRSGRALHRPCRLGRPRRRGGGRAPDRPTHHRRFRGARRRPQGHPHRAGVLRRHPRARARRPRRADPATGRAAPPRPGRRDRRRPPRPVHPPGSR